MDVYSSISFNDEDRKKLQEIWQGDYVKVIEGMCFALARTFSCMLPLVKILMSDGGYLNSHGIQLVVSAGITTDSVMINLYITPNASEIEFRTDFHAEVKRPKKLLVKPERKDIPHGMPMEWGNKLIFPLIKEYESDTARNGLPKKMQKKLQELARVFEENPPRDVIKRDCYKYPYND